MSARTGGPAFPRPHSWDESPSSGIHEGDRPEPHGAQGGMTLRDYFAAQAMQAIVAKLPLRDQDTGINEHHLMVAAGAYHYADAMLKERAK